MVLRFTALALLLTAAMGVACTTFGSGSAPPVDDASAPVPDGSASPTPGEPGGDARVPVDAGTDGARPGGRGFIFVSKDYLNGAMGPAQSAADGLCIREARTAGLGGSFVALLRLAASDDLAVRLAGSKGRRFVPGADPGARPALRVDAFAIDAFGPVTAHADGTAVAPGTFVWTGGFEPLEAGACRDAGPWTSDNAFFSGIFGDPRQSGPNAGNYGLSSCDQKNRVYCVEVGDFE